MLAGAGLVDAAMMRRDDELLTNATVVDVTTTTNTVTAVMTGQPSVRSILTLN